MFYVCLIVFPILFILSVATAGADSPIEDIPVQHTDYIEGLDAIEEAYRLEDEAAYLRGERP